MRNKWLYVSGLVIVLIVGGFLYYMVSNIVAYWSKDVVGQINTTTSLIGLPDKINIEVFDDPKISNASCFVSYAQKGGVSGALGLAESPSRFAVTCLSLNGPVCVAKNTRSHEQVWETAASLFFKEFRVYRMIDEPRKVIVYVATSTQLLDGSPANSIAAIPLSPPEMCVK